MAGMKFEYDEEGGKFYYFCISFYALILVPITYWLWPKNEKRENKSHPEDTLNFPPCRTKYQCLRINGPNRPRRATLTKIGLVLAWIILLVLAYRVSLIEIEHKEYDPFRVLNIDRETSIGDIKRAYRELSKKYHPDRGGDPEKFKDIAKAYRTLTDEEAHENWKKYGNPDGPGVTHFGIALPKWLVDHKNAIFVLLIYTNVFMIVLPIIICTWWHKSARYAGDQILRDTVNIYFYFLTKTSWIVTKRAIMILSASAEFHRGQNPIIVDRPSDNIELPKLIRELSDVQEKSKERPFQEPYSVKARTLIYAHLHRFDCLSENLEKDKQYVVRRTVYLINEMINIEAQLVSMSHNGQIKIPPRLDTIENTMKLSPMIVQALPNLKSPLLQLPYITETHLRFFETKKRSIKSIRQFVAMDDEQRRDMLRSITDEQYYEIMNVLAIYPQITMIVSFGVFDDEDEHMITTGAVVTLTVRLHRDNMSSVFSKALGANLYALLNVVDDETNEEQIDDEENRDKTNETLKVSTTATASSLKGWNNKSEKKKKANKEKAKKKVQSISSKVNNKQISSNKNNIKNQTKNENKYSSDDDDDDSSKHFNDVLLNSSQNLEQTREDLNERDDDSSQNNRDNRMDENIPNNTISERSQLSLSNKVNNRDNDNEQDTFLEKFQQQQRKREKLETKAKISHRVFCPFYPEIKQECWWLYVADRKHHSLISLPIYLCTLKDDEEVEIKFSAPKEPGHYVYSVILTSDSYIDVDVTENLSFDVKAAKDVSDKHPQWDFGDDDDEANRQVEANEFTTESDSDKDD